MMIAGVSVCGLRTGNHPRWRELPDAVDVKQSARCHPGCSSQGSFLDWLWFAVKAVIQLKVGGVCSLTVRLRLVARQQSKDLLGRSLGLSFSSVYVYEVYVHRCV